MPIIKHIHDRKSLGAFRIFDLIKIVVGYAIITNELDVIEGYW